MGRNSEAVSSTTYFDVPLVTHRHKPHPLTSAALLAACHSIMAFPLPNVIMRPWAMVVVWSLKPLNESLVLDCTFAVFFWSVCINVQKITTGLDPLWRYVKIVTIFDGFVEKDRSTNAFFTLDLYDLMSCECRWNLFGSYTIPFYYSGVNHNSHE